MKFVAILEARTRQQHGHHLRWQNLQMKKSNMGEFTQTLNLIVQNQIGIAR